MRVMFSALALLALSACASLSDRARESLDQPGLEGTRWGLVVMTMDGRELVSIRPDERFLPASNTKLFTTAAAFHRLGDMTQPDPNGGTWLRGFLYGDGYASLTLVGAGDPTLSDTPDCERNCLSDLADAVAAQGVTHVTTLSLDVSIFPYEPWPPGWSQEDRYTRSGAPVSSLTVNNNVWPLTIKPAATVESWTEYDITTEWDLWTHVDVESVAEPTTLDDLIVFADGSEHEWSGTDEDGVNFTIKGRVTAGAPPITLQLPRFDPANVARKSLIRHLNDRNIAVDEGTWGIGVRYPVDPIRDGSSGQTEMEIARLVPPPLIENVTFLMKQSQNLHAELLLRRLGLLEGDGSREAGLAVVEAMLAEAGVPRWTWDLSDGSGMSVYNRVTPRMTADFLLWTAKQPWAQAYRDTLPIGAVDGTLRRRFAGTSLEGRIFAKSGTLRGTNALSGFMLTKSGQMLLFAAFANERPSEGDSAIAALDATLVAISETN
jgi:D-alanyl-D-alanine carboxypeptidase/D-alanyl-D-alanine-endopeptidase (penicillin-binding protein 4)